MRFARLGPVGHEIPVVQHDGRSFDLRSITPTIDGQFFASGGVDRVRNALAELPELDATGLRIGAPSTNRPRSSASASTTATTRRRPAQPSPASPSCS